MRRRFRRKPRRKELVPRMRVNNAIFAKHVTLIDNTGKNHGEVSIADARRIAEEQGMDLVEVSPKAEPPVCKVLDYGKFHYQQAKQYRQSKSHQKKVGTKGIRLGLRTDAHDLLFKKDRAEKFLTKGNKVKVEILLRGREKAHLTLAKDHVKNFLTSIAIPYKIEEDLKKFPKGFSIIIAP